MIIDETPEFFRSPDSQGRRMIMYRRSTPVSDGDLLLSSDGGVTFREMVARGFAGSTLKHHLSFTDPVGEFNHELQRDGDNLILGHVLFEKFDGPQEEVTIVPLPDVRKSEYLFAIEDTNVLIYVSAAKYKYSYGSFRLFIGDSNALVRVPDIKVVRYRDGGTTILRTPQGVLHSPTPFKDEAATWKADGVKKLLKLDPAQFVIQETKDVAKVEKK